MGLGTFTQWENLCGVLVLQLVCCPPVGMGFDFIMVASLLPSCGFSLAFDIFLVGSCILLSMVVQQLVAVQCFHRKI